MRRIPRRIYGLTLRGLVLAMSGIPACCLSGGNGNGGPTNGTTPPAWNVTTPIAGEATFELPVPFTIVYPNGASGPVPITVGVPLSTGSFSTDALTVVGPAGPVPTQVREVARLGGNQGITWLLIDFQALPDEDYALDRGTPPVASQSIKVLLRGAGGYQVETGAGYWGVPETSDLLGGAADANGTLRVRDATWGERWPAALQVVEAGPLRAMIRVRAQQAVAGLDLVARWHFYAGLPYARLRITLINHNDCPLGSTVPFSDNGACGIEAAQPTCNGLLSAGRIEVEDITWALRLANATGTNEVIYQDSSGTDRWDTYLGLGPRMQSGVAFRGFLHTQDGVETARGDAAAGVLSDGGVRLDVPWFRELFPKALRARNGRLELGLFPGEFSTRHRFRAGEQKTHDLWVCLGPGVTPPWPVYAVPDFDWLRASHALGYIGPRVAGSFTEYENYLDDQFDPNRHVRDDCNNDLDECASSILDARRRWDYYGWTDFGDVPTDHENPRSPLNMKYDLNLGFLNQALRTGDVRWWELAHAGNIHCADVDILHSPKRGYGVDRAWYEGGTWGHSQHNEDGLANPHRNCGNPAPDLYYGGAGMAAWVLLTGDNVVREAAVELADNTLWRALNTSDTACARQAWGGGNGEGYTVWQQATPTARPVANTQRILTWAWRLTGDNAYLDGAAGAARWTQCEAAGFTCSSWPEALLARSMGEYITAARDANVALDPAAVPALGMLLRDLAAHTTRQRDRVWLSGCTGDEINAWMFLAADAFAYGYAVSGDQVWLDDYAQPSFSTAAQDPYYEGDTSQYHTSKELTNAVSAGTVFLHFAQKGLP